MSGFGGPIIHRRRRPTIDWANKHEPLEGAVNVLDLPREENPPRTFDEWCERYAAEKDAEAENKRKAEMGDAVMSAQAKAGWDTRDRNGNGRKNKPRREIDPSLELPL